MRLKVALKLLNNDITLQPNTIVEASRLLKKMDQLETAFMIVIWNTIMERFNKVNKYFKPLKLILRWLNELYGSLYIFVQEV